MTKIFKVKITFKVIYKILIKLMKLDKIFSSTNNYALLIILFKLQKSLFINKMSLDKLKHSTSTLKANNTT